MSVLARGWVFIIPLVVVVYTLFLMNLYPAKVGIYGALSAIAVGLFRRDGRVALRRFFMLLEQTGRVLLEVLVIGAAAGIVIGLVTITGLGFLLTLAASHMMGGNLFLLLIITAVVAICLGMGMATIPVYVLLALILAPPLVEYGVLPLAAHLFVFYFGMVSLVTPPICVAAYAAASLAQAHPMRTGFTAMRMGIMAYFVPFLFVFSPALLMAGSWADIFLTLLTAAAGVIFLAVALTGYLYRKLNMQKRTLVGLAALALMVPISGPAPFYNWFLDVLGTIVIVGFVFCERRWSRLLDQKQVVRGELRRKELCKRS
jgi:TRAP-type uncharacterized transport system fused permease subunit